MKDHIAFHLFNISKNLRARARRLAKLHCDQGILDSLLPIANDLHRIAERNRDHSTSAVIPIDLRDLHHLPMKPNHATK